MNNKLKILVCCGNGAGTSLMLKINVEKIAKKMGLQIERIYHCAISEGKSISAQYDIVLCTHNFTSLFTDAEKKGVKIIGLKNIMSAQEIEKKLNSALQD